MLRKGFKFKMTMTQDVYDVKYRVQTILRDFLVKDLRPGKADKFEISCRVFDDAYDMICFYVPKADVVMHDDKVTCDVYLMEPVYDFVVLVWELYSLLY